MSRFNPTFRIKLLIALLATIAPALLVTLVVVRREADRQVAVVVERTGKRAGEAFARIDGIRQQQLAQLGLRITNSNRWGAALQTAFDGDTTTLVQQINYEFQLTGFTDALAAFTDLSGEPVAAVIGNNRLPDPRAAVSKDAIDRIFAGDTAVYSYLTVANHLYSIHPVIIGVADVPMGIAQFGFPVDDETARSLGRALGAEVCFMAQGKCVARSEAVKAGQFATITQPLPGTTGASTQLRLRIPLDDVVRPFTAITRAITIVGFVVLLLAILVSLLLSRGLARPVRALVAATQRVARGDYNAHVPVQTKDELGTLAESFNAMTDGLLLKEKYRGVLDKVVSRDVAEEMLKGEIQLGGELREVTTLFADVRGFTAMSEGMPPHDVVTLLNEVMERAEAAVVAEGGVVDKYVGDEIMALFGAPGASREDDAIRAVRAAMQIQQDVAQLNSQVKLGIGINTGTVVAGNMGSARRLNYTVIGAPVNLAARLCSEAQGGQILISEATRQKLASEVATTSVGKRIIKGLAQPIELFEVKSLVHAVALIACLLFGAVTSAHAQRTLTTGPLQIQPSARVDLVGFVTDDKPAWLIPSTSSFLAPRVSGYADIFLGSHLYSLLELRVDRGEAPSDGNLQMRVEQAYIRIAPTKKIDTELQVGRFVSPFGNYPQRHHSTSDPLIRPPLTYDYRTMVSCDIPPKTSDGFITWKDDPDFWRPLGAPPVWAAPYQLGAMLLGSYRRVSYRFALMNGAPSAEPRVWNYMPSGMEEMSYVANVGVQITPEFRIGASYQYGAYLNPETPDSVLPKAKHWTDYYQAMKAVEASFSRGIVELRGEYIHDGWEVPNVGEDPVDRSYYVEGKVKVGVGAFVSARYSYIGFNELPLSSGALSQWDYDTRRYQLGAGYRISQPLEIRAEYMVNRTQTKDPKDNLFAVQASWVLN